MRLQMSRPIERASRAAPEAQRYAANERKLSHGDVLTGSHGHRRSVAGIRFSLQFEDRFGRMFRTLRLGRTSTKTVCDP